MANAISTINELDRDVAPEHLSAKYRYHSSCTTRKNIFSLPRSRLLSLLSHLQYLRAECSKITLGQYLIVQEADTARVYRSERQLSDFALGRCLKNTREMFNNR